TNNFSIVRFLSLSGSPPKRIARESSRKKEETGRHEPLRQPCQRPGSYRRRDAGFGIGSQSYGRGYESSSKREAELGAHSNGLTPFEKNFYVESPSVAKADVEAYRCKREIADEGRDVPEPALEFRDVAFLGWFSFPHLARRKDTFFVKNQMLDSFLARICHSGTRVGGIILFHGMCDHERSNLEQEQVFGQVM
ncbi:uncharacterized protein, partial [Elaeis guineensis]|uniref:uncharacterized protein n=1 Tax=Elaeis guineensis var. tenera TaxID=51953 RepID=UPI003C6DAA67